VDLTNAEMQLIVDRLWYEGKIQRLQKFTTRSSSSSYGGGGYTDDSSSSCDEDEGGEEVSDGLWMYKAVRLDNSTSSSSNESASSSSAMNNIGGLGVDGQASWLNVPCGKCPVAQFCKPDGPISPSNCVYLEGW
jgi:hypothetical protein